MIKIVIIDDYDFTRYSIKMLLSADKNIEIFAEAQTVVEELETINIHTPHIAFVNLHFADDSSLLFVIETMKLPTNFF
ncbi:response regulator transcription factor [Trichormus azollae]|jgi:DNA-binding NarL/FixJ family response regulator|uniref:Response regulator receiver protein n=1 Tax=Nostoc azollae (strain 0708) TaxID=551115 RepID=D7E5L1_NOSA0|nr:response regulator transcription factor [Trichormus azollae]ADI66270.1 response regulator receiver protein ['Nostoc azollae' 0708]